MKPFGARPVISHVYDQNKKMKFGNGILLWQYFASFVPLAAPFRTAATLAPPPPEVKTETTRRQ
jgi:hypothetical protein